MADKVFRLIVDVDSRKAKRGAKEAETSMQRLSSRIQTVGKYAAAAAPLMAAVVVRSAIRNAMEQEQALAGVASQIRATGNAAGTSTAAMAAYASELQRATGIGDEVTLRTTAMLLSFKQLNEEGLKRTLKISQDVASVMGGDLQTTALMLAKALADPVARLGELSRSGIVFTDAQKDVIKSMVETGDLMKAQSMILDEIESQYGGAAAAARDTLGGALQGLKAEIGDLTEKWVLNTGASSELASSLNELASVLAFLNDNFDAVSTGAQRFYDVMLGGLPILVRGFQDAAQASGEWIRTQAGLREELGLNESHIESQGEKLQLLANKYRELNGLAPRLEGIQVRVAARFKETAESVDLFAKATEDMLRLAAAPLQSRLSATNAALETHRKKLDEIEKEYRQAIAAIRETLKNIQALEKNALAFEVSIGLGDVDLDGLTEAVQDSMDEAMARLDPDLTALNDSLTIAIADAFDPGAGFLGTFTDEFRDQITNSLVQAFASGDIDSAIDAVGNALQAAVTKAVSETVGSALGEGLGAAIGAPAIGALAGGLAGQLFGSLFGDDDSEEQAKEMAAAFDQLHDTIRSSMPGIRQEVIETFGTILEMLRLVAEAGQSTGEEMAAIQRELQSTADSITGVSTGDFADRLRAAQEFNDTLLTMAQEVQDAFDQIELGGLAESIAAEFMGITSHLDLMSLERDARQLREAINGLGLESDKAAALIRQVRDAEKLRAQELRAGVFAQLADLMERAGIRSAEVAQLRAKYEQLQFQVALKRLEVEIKLLDMWSKATAAIIGELTQFASNIGNFVSGVSAGFAEPIRIPRGGGRGGRRGRRRRRRQDLLDELESLMSPSGGSLTFADKLRDLNTQFAELRKRAVKLKVPLDKVNAAYEAQVRALREAARSSLVDFRESLVSGPMSQMSMQQRFFMARSRFNDLARRAAAGDLDATAQLGAAGQEYLDLARQMFGTTQQFKDIFDEVLNLVNGVLGTGGLKDEEASRHDQVLSQMEQSDVLRMDFHDEAQDKRERIKDHTKKTWQRLDTLIQVMERMEAA